MNGKILRLTNCTWSVNVRFLFKIRPRYLQLLTRVIGLPSTLTLASRPKSMYDVFSAFIVGSRFSRFRTLSKRRLPLTVLLTWKEVNRINGLYQLSQTWSSAIKNDLTIPWHFVYTLNRKLPRTIMPHRLQFFGVNWSEFLNWPTRSSFQINRNAMIL